MPAFVWTLLWWMAAYALIGVALYIFDREKGVHWYRAYYNRTRTKPMPETTLMGFIVGQKNANVRLKYLARAITIVHAVTMFWEFHYDAFIALGMVFLDYLGLLAGYRLLGPKAHKMWTKADNVDHIIDRVEGAAEASKDKMPAAIESLKSFVLGALLYIPRLVKNVVYPDSPDAPPPVRPGVPKE